MKNHECQVCTRPAMGGSVCRPCMGNLIPELRSIADLSRHADDKRARFGSSWRTGTIGRTQEAPLPYDPRVTAVMAKVTRVLQEARDAAESIEQAKVRCEDQPGAIASWLTSRVYVLRRHPKAGRLHARILNANERLENLFDGPPERLYVGQCRHDDCGTPLYINRETHTASVVACPKCKAETSIDERRAELAAGVADYRSTVRELSRFLTETLGEDVSRGRIYGLVRAGLLISPGVKLERNSRGEWREVPTYRIGDVREAVATMRANKETERAVKRAQRQEQSA